MSTSPKLAPQRLNELPLKYRKTVKGVLAGGADYTRDLVRLTALIKLATSKEILSLLPLFHAILDPRRIPPGAQLENLTLDSRCAVTSADWAIHILMQDSTLPAHVIREHIWARMVDWLSFLHAYGAHLPSDLRPPLMLSPLTLCRFVRYSLELTVSKEELQHTVANLKFLTLLLSGWEASLGMPHDSFFMAVLGAVMSCIYAFEDSPLPGQMIIDASGGGLSHLAGIIMKHFSIVTALQPVQKENCNLIVFAFLLAVKLEKGNKEDSFGPSSMFAALICAPNALETLIGTLNFAVIQTVTHGEDLAHTIHAAHTVLSLMFLAPPDGFRRLAHAIDLKFLELSVICARLTHAQIFHYWDQLFVALTRISVFHPILSAMSRNLPRAETAGENPPFKACPLYRPWNVFVRIAHLRIETLHRYEAPGRITVGGCDNLTCLRMDEKSLFRSCSRCKTASYCSAACQRADWRIGGHRNVCAAYREVQSDLYARFTPRERSFIRFLLTENYVSYRKEILNQDLLHLVPARGGEDEYVTTFDYFGGFPPFFSNVSLASERWLVRDDADDRAILEHQARRARQSRGRLVVHVLHMVDRYGSSGKFRWLMPLRSTAPNAARGALAPLYTH
ncbi:hypothetical protein C8F01DRAFT_1339031, partial [Mycena amicta]